MISMNFFVRPMRTGEVDLLRVIEKRARERYLSFKSFERSAESPAIAPERFDGAEALVAVRQDTLIGFVLLQAIDRHLYVANISVVPEASGYGVGRLLLDAGEERAAAQSAPAMTLTTFKTPPWNGPWFRP